MKGKKTKKINYNPYANKNKKVFVKRVKKLTEKQLKLLEQNRRWYKSKVASFGSSSKHYINSIKTCR